MITVSLSISGDTPAQVAEVFRLLITPDQLVITGLDEIKEQITKLGIDQSLVDQIFQQVSENKQKLESVLKT